MKKLPLIVLIFFSIFLTACKKEKTESTFDSEIENIIKSNISFDDKPGIVVGIIRNGVKKFYTFGVANKETNAEIDENTIFEIGSITKTFTGLIFAQFFLENRFEQDDLANNYLPEELQLPEKDSKGVKIIHLLNHSSGLPREPEDMDPSEPGLYTENQMAEYLSQVSLLTTPGEAFLYSNTGMGLAGMLLENISDSTYESLCKSRIFSKLSMNSTFCNNSETPELNVAQGYFGDNPVDFYEWTNVFASAGCIKSNMHDMLIYMQAYLNPEITSLNNSINLSMEPTYEMQENVGIGIAWFLGLSEQNNKLIFHDGGTKGFSSFIGINKEEEAGVVVLINAYCFNEQVIIGSEIMELFEKY